MVLKAMRRLTLQEAKVQVARLSMAQEEARKAWAEFRSHEAPETAERSKEEIPTQDPEAEKKAKEAWEARNEERKRFLCELATDPELRKHMDSCSVWFVGSQEPRWAEEGRELNSAEFTKTLKSEDNSLSRKVRDWIQGKGYHVSGSGGGCGGWDLDVCGSYEELAKLCDMAHEELREYLDTEVLRISFKLYEFSLEVHPR